MSYRKKIDELEKEQAELQRIMADGSFYKKSADEIAKAMQQLSEIEQALLEAYARWEQLDK